MSNHSLTMSAECDYVASTAQMMNPLLAIPTVGPLLGPLPGRCLVQTLLEGRLLILGLRGLRPDHLCIKGFDLGRWVST